MDLTNWTLEHIKARDAMTKTLVSHSVQGDEIICEHKHMTQHFVVNQKLFLPETKDNLVIVCLHTKENVSTLINCWTQFQKPRLVIMFVNITENLFWKINPLLHNQVADPQSLQAGIESLAEAVPYID